MQHPELVFALTLNALCLTSAVWANADGEQCYNQMKEALRTDVNCVISFGSASEEEVMSNTQGVFKNYICRMPMQFPKSDIYGSWIKQNSISLPTLQLNCDLNAVTGEVLKASAKIRPSCKKVQAAWLCDINMSETVGLGVLGHIIENHVNNNQKIKTEFGSLLGKIGNK